MEQKIEKLLDKIGKNIVNALQQNARISFSDLGRKVGLSTPAVTERVRKLEESGLISGYHAAVDTAKIGLPVTAFIHLTTSPENYSRIKRLISSLQPIIECHHISGEESFVIKAAVPSIPDLESLVDQLSPYGKTRTAVVLSSQVNKKGVLIE